MNKADSGKENITIMADMLKKFSQEISPDPLQDETENDIATEEHEQVQMETQQSVDLFDTQPESMDDENDSDVDLLASEDQVSTDSSDPEETEEVNGGTEEFNDVTVTDTQILTAEASAENWGKSPEADTADGKVAPEITAPEISAPEITAAKEVNARGITTRSHSSSEPPMNYSTLNSVGFQASTSTVTKPKSKTTDNKEKKRKRKGEDKIKKNQEKIKATEDDDKPQNTEDVTKKSENAENQIANEQKNGEDLEENDQNKIRDLLKSEATLTKNLNNAENKISDLQAEQAKKQTAIEKLQKQLSDANLRNAQGIKQFNKNKQELEQTIEDLKQQAQNNKEQKANALTQQKDSKTAQLIANQNLAQNRIKDLENDKIQLKNDLQTATRFKTTTENEQSIAQNKISDLETKKLELETDLQTAANSKIIMESDMDSALKEIAIKETEIKALIEENVKLLNQTEQLKLEVDNLILKCIQAQEEEATQTSKIQTEQKTTVIIADSNGKRIKPKLPRDENIEWLHIKDVYRAKDIPEKIKQEEAMRHLKKADSIIVMVGLNEIQDGMKAFDIVKSIDYNIQPLIATGKPISIAEIPPVANSISDKTEARMLNNMLTRLPKKYKNVVILETWNALCHCELNEEIYETDMFHLDTDKKGTTVVANIIAKHTKTIHQDAPPSEIITEEIEIEAGTAQCYIGAAGNNLKQMTTNHKVNISVPRNRNKVIITGAKENVETAKVEIMELKATLRGSYSQENNNRGRIPCRFFAKGTCARGENCGYIHSTDVHQPRPRNRDQHNEQRTRSRSNTRGNEQQTDRERHYPRSRSNSRENRYRSDREQHHAKNRDSSINRSDERRSRSNVNRERNSSPGNQPRHTNMNRGEQGRTQENYHDNRHRNWDSHYHTQ